MTPEASKESRASHSLFLFVCLLACLLDWLIDWLIVCFAFETRRQRYLFVWFGWSVSLFVCLSDGWLLCFVLWVWFWFVCWFVCIAWHGGVGLQTCKFVRSGYVGYFSPIAISPEGVFWSDFLSSGRFSIDWKIAPGIFQPPINGNLSKAFAGKERSVSTAFTWWNVNAGKCKRLVESCRCNVVFALHL